MYESEFNKKSSRSGSTPEFDLLFLIWNIAVSHQLLQRTLQIVIVLSHYITSLQVIEYLWI